MKNYKKKVFTLLFLIYPQSSGFANPVISPVEISLSLIFLSIPVGTEVFFTSLVLKNYPLNSSRFTYVWFIFNIVSFLLFMYSLDSLKPLLNPFFDYMLLPFVGELIVILTEGLLLFYMLKISWFYTEQPMTVPLYQTLKASALGNTVSALVPLFFFYSFFGKLLIHGLPIIIMIVIFLLFFFFRKRNYIQKRHEQAVYLSLVLVIAAGIITLSLTGHYHIPWKSLYKRDRINFDPRPSDLKDPELRGLIVSRLSDRNDEKTIEELITLLNDNDINVRFDAIRVLGNINNTQAAGPLIKILNDKEPAIVDAAMYALAQINAPEAIEPLVDIINNPDSYNRKDALKALSEFRDPRAVEAIFNCFDHSDPDIYELAVIKLGEKKDPRAVAPLLTLLYNEKTGNKKDVIEILGNFQEIRATEPIIKKLKDEDLEIRISSAAALGKIGNEKAVEPLISLLKDENPRLREETIKALKKMNSQQTVLPVIDALNDRNMQVRRASVKALGVFKDARAVEPLISIFKNDREKSIRNNAALALGNINDPRAVEPLTDAIDDKRYSQYYIGLSLSKFNTPKAEAALLWFLIEGNWKSISGAHEYYIANEIPDSEKKIIKALKKSNLKKMANNMKKSNNAILRNAAEEWLEVNQGKFHNLIELFE